MNVAGRGSLAFRAGDATLRGTLAVPAGHGPFPAIVVVHGASDGGRDARLYRHLESVAVPLGIAVLRFDRRGSGESEGDFLTAHFGRLADDVLAAVARLRSHRRIDASRICLFGFSQGAWIAPEAAARKPQAVTGLVVVGACGVTPAAQMMHSALSALRLAGYAHDVLEEVRALRTAIDAVVRDRREPGPLRSRIAAASRQSWFPLAYLPALSVRPGDEADEAKWRLEMDYDVRPVLRRLVIPALVVHGVHDRWVPVDASRRVWRRWYGDPSRLRMVRLGDAGHFPTTAAGMPGEERAPYSPRYAAELRGWLTRWTAAGSDR